MKYNIVYSYISFETEITGTIIKIFSTKMMKDEVILIYSIDTLSQFTTDTYRSLKIRNHKQARRKQFNDIFVNTPD